MSAPHPRRAHPAFARLWSGVFILSISTVAIAGGDDIFRDGFEPITLATVEEVQLGMTSGTVLLADRVVTAISANRRHLWVADSATSTAYQGVFVFRSSTQALGGEFVVGARVNVLGTAVEFDVAPASGNTLTQVEASSVALAAATQTPVPLDFAGVAVLASIVDGEPYEGVLVRVTNVRVTGTLSGNRVVVTDNAGATLILDDDAGAFGSAIVGTCYASVTGVMHLNVFDDVRVLLPRSAVDLVGGSSCN